MTREEQRKLKEAKKQAKIALREQKKQDAQDFRAWQKMVERASSKGAWIEDNTPKNNLHN
jgi:hypothetical protein